MIQLSKGGNINLAKEANGITEFSIGLDVAAQAGSYSWCCLQERWRFKAVGEFN